MLVSSVTTLDNSTSLPCAFNYVKAGKSGEEMKSIFSSPCKTLQVCKRCLSTFACHDNVLGPEVTTDNDLALLVPLPDCPHVGKSFKVSFANWYLKLGNERGNLTILRTLRNKSDPSTKAEMRKLVPKNHYVRNKDRQDPMAVVMLTEENLTSFLESLDYVGHARHHPRARPIP